LVTVENIILIGEDKLVIYAMYIYECMTFIMPHKQVYSDIVYQDLHHPYRACIW